MADVESCKVNTVFLTREFVGHRTEGRRGRAEEAKSLDQQLNVMRKSSQSSAGASEASARRAEKYQSCFKGQAMY